MSINMVQHLTHTSYLPHMEFMRLNQIVVIEGKDGGQTIDPLNIEQPIMV